MDVKKVRSPNLCSSRLIGSWIGSIEVMTVDVVPVVKVEHWKELLTQTYQTKEEGHSRHDL
jgi:hypothetical protein